MTPEKETLVDFVLSTLRKFPKMSSRDLTKRLKKAFNEEQDYAEVINLGRSEFRHSRNLAEKHRKPSRSKALPLPSRIPLEKIGEEVARMVSRAVGDIGKLLYQHSKTA